MTTPNPAPAQGEPLKPCPWCNRTPAWHGIGLVYCDSVMLRCPMAGHGMFLADWNRRASPPAPDGEVGRLVELLGEWIERRRSIGCHSDAGLFGDVRDCLLAQSAALTAQAAALEEAEGRFAKTMEQGGFAIAAFASHELQHATESLKELGCRMGEGGVWEKRVTLDDNGCFQGANCGHNACNRWEPIITAPAKGEGET